MNVYLIVLDSVGIGAAPDASDYGDTGANTLAHTAAACGGLHLPTLQAMGLGNIPALTDGQPIAGVPPVAAPIAAFGAMQERSAGKDTTTGHWEIAGLLLEKPLHIFPPGPPSFPPDLLDALRRATGREVLGNKAANGTAIIDELGPEQLRTGAWIAYTSADSVFQIAAHEPTIPLDTLYAACRLVRQHVNPLQVGRVIARPYVGTPGHFSRTDNRRDFSLPLPEKSILSDLAEHTVNVITVGKLDDIFPDCGIGESFHVENNPDAIEAVLSLARRGRMANTLIFANLIDFDMRHGHRRDATGYGAALETADRFIQDLLELLAPEDLVIITADHGNDPTFKGSDHTREYVPLLVYGHHVKPGGLGVRQGFFDIAQSLATVFGIPALQRGVSFSRTLAPTPLKHLTIRDQPEPGRIKIGIGQRRTR
ncbi:MAG TPA: phosphopentomutase [Verrucomicrobia bacterium]|nr:phosphopentomutase [Verrucomicrobiota bacterium]